MHFKHGMKTTENYFSTKYTRLGLVVAGDLVAILQQLLTQDLVTTLDQSGQGKLLPRPGGISLLPDLLEWNLLCHIIALPSLPCALGLAFLPWGPFTVGLLGCDCPTLIRVPRFFSVDFYTRFSSLMYVLKHSVNVGVAFVCCLGLPCSHTQVSAAHLCSAVRSTKRQVGYPPRTRDLPSI